MSAKHARRATPRQREFLSFSTRACFRFAQLTPLTLNLELCRSSFIHEFLHLLKKFFFLNFDDFFGLGKCIIFKICSCTEFKVLEKFLILRILRIYSDLTSADRSAQLSTPVPHDRKNQNKTSKFPNFYNFSVSLLLIKSILFLQIRIIKAN